MIHLNNSDYWSERFALLEKSQINKGIDYYNNIRKQYDLAVLNIEKEISIWYQRFANNNGIVSMYEAKKLLNSNQLKELRWTLEEYIKFGKENAINQKWIKQLENASAKVHINRLEALKLQCQQQVEVLYGNELDGVDRLLRNIYTEGFYKTGFEIAKGTNIGTTFTQLDAQRIEKVISKPWTSDGTNFSERIWGKYRPELIDKIHTGLTQNIKRGEPQDKLIKKISKAFNVSKFKAGRLIMSESAFFASAAQKDCFNDLDIEIFKVVAALDSTTCKDCGKYDGKPIAMKDYKVGTNAPPFHSFCRCTTAPYFNDEFTEKDMRFSRDENGRPIYVPANISYDDWKEKFVKPIDISDDNLDNSIRNPNVGDDYKLDDVLKQITDKIKSISDLNTRYILELRLNPENFRINKKADIPYAFLPGGKKKDESGIIEINPYTNDFKSYDPIESLIHEIGHMFDDDNDGISWKDKDFRNAVEEMSAHVALNYNKYSILMEKDLYYYNMPLSDIMSALTRNEIHGAYLHLDKYWNDDSDLIFQEIFADLFSAYYANDIVAIDLIKKDFKDLYNAFLALTGIRM